MVAHAIRAVMKYRAYAQIIFQVAEGVFNFLEVLVMRDHSRVGDLLGRGIGSQEIKAVALGFGVD